MPPSLDRQTDRLADRPTGRQLQPAPPFEGVGPVSPVLRPLVRNSRRRSGCFCAAAAADGCAADDAAADDVAAAADDAADAADADADDADDADS